MQIAITVNSSFVALPTSIAHVTVAGMLRRGQEVKPCSSCFAAKVAFKSSPQQRTAVPARTFCVASGPALSTIIIKVDARCLKSLTDSGNSMPTFRSQLRKTSNISSCLLLRGAPGTSEGLRKRARSASHLAPYGGFLWHPHINGSLWTHTRRM